MEKLFAQIHEFIQNLSGVETGIIILISLTLFSFIQNLSGVRTLSKTLREQEHYYEIFTESHALALRLDHRHHNARRNLSHIDIIHTPPVTRTLLAVRQSIHSV